MHAHNELTILNRMLMFTDGELHNSAQSVQMWCMLQILAAKLFETWIMLAERFLRRTHPMSSGAWSDRGPGTPVGRHHATAFGLTAPSSRRDFPISRLTSDPIACFAAVRFSGSAMTEDQLDGTAMTEMQKPPSYAPVLTSAARIA
jgi:hypothetical protein